ncbi:hypothetical protein [Azospirillum rugosum]|uniref:Outer membrane lipoprotein SlyB n=1 Tax=Azospirillum rugosum TaxID=416170 RepID=A0ABS4SW14_9PROT|nr:hypothetical protein [Azospirillum rugosum]MBP2296652.1 outer membrane lipoprotein SlyB [Azospirillum rugosum]MDQ0530289.1 outer membrane lipoprotein SlyB [Azospirillum rugosum]
MTRTRTFGLSAVVLAGFLAGCTPNYSPNTYAATATQQANKVERAVVIGFREVKISTNGTVGAVTGGAAGGVLGSQSGAIGMNAALGAVTGTAIGGLLGTSIEHVTGDTTGWEYIVRKPDGELLSLTQKEERPLAVGQKVLVITGSQARIIPDYATENEPAVAKDKPKAEEPAKAEDPKPEEKKPDAAVESGAAEAKAVEAKELPPAATPAPATVADPAPATEPAVKGGPISIAPPAAPAPAADAAPVQAQPTTSTAATSAPSAGM